MSKNFIVITIILAIELFGNLFISVYCMAQIDIARAQEVIFNEVQMFLDKTSDTMVITTRDLEDFTLAMSSTSVPIKFTIIREARQVNPDPGAVAVDGVTPTYTTWVPVEDIYNYDDNDFIKVEISQAGSTFYQAFAERILRMYVPRIQFTLGRMVR